MEVAEIQRVQRYLRDKFQLGNLKIVPQKGKDDSAELYLGDEFLGVIYRDEEEGELSYDLHMSILDIDLPADA